MCLVLNIEFKQVKVLISNWWNYIHKMMLFSLEDEASGLNALVKRRNVSTLAIKFIKNASKQIFIRYNSRFRTGQIVTDTLLCILCSFFTYRL